MQSRNLMTLSILCAIESNQALSTNKKFDEKRKNINYAKPITSYTFLVSRLKKYFCDILYVS